MEGPRKRTLQRALKVLGSSGQLAQALSLPLSELESYLEGEKELPEAIFLRALDIVASTPRPARHAED
jgi:hypothetical protein